MVNNSIIEHKSYEKLLKEFHPTKNGDIKLSDFSYGSHKKVWWKCDVADDHEWETKINLRINGSGCPCCCGRKVVKSNCLATTRPEIAIEWHPTKNEDLTPNDVISGSDKKVWWRCDKASDHEWEAAIKDRAQGNDCSCCTGKKVVLSNCLATTHPELTKQWHPTKNVNLTPNDVISGSNKKVWWKCDVADDHVWKVSINNRTNGRNCPCCAGRKVAKSNCLTTTYPELTKQWHPIKNGSLTANDIVAGSYNKVWWKCDKEYDHEWEATISDRAKGSNCPCCSGRKVVKSNCLATTYPEIASQWHPIKNINQTPYDVTAGRATKIWWKCSYNNKHEWNAKICHITSGSGCPHCSKSKGQKEVEFVLKKHKIIYETEKTFDGCRHKGLLRFDIHLTNLNILIEYDGKQHFESIGFMGGQKALEDVQKRDKIKDEYAKNNNIHLLRIPYTEFNNIENIITNYINNIYPKLFADSSISCADLSES